MKKTLLTKLTLDKDRRAFKNELVPVSRVKYFWFLYRKNSPQIMKVNMLMILFALPLILSFTIFPSMFKGQVMGESVRYFMGNFGIGYPAINDSMLALKLALIGTYKKSVLIWGAGLFIAGLGICGSFYCARNIAWGVPVKPFRDFFKGIKLYILPFLLIFAVLGGLLIGGGMVFVWFIGLKTAGLATFWSWLAVIGVSICALFILVVCVHLFPMLSAYKFKLRHSLKNSLILGISLFPVTIFIVIATIAPMLLALTNTFVALMIFMLFVMFGCGFYCLMWTSYAHYTFEVTIKPLYEAQFKAPKKGKKAKKNAQNAQPNTEDGSQNPVINMDAPKQPKQQFKNPKKKKKG